MPELWELCNNESKAVLMQLYYEEYGKKPDFYYELTGRKRKLDTVEAPDYQEEQEIEIQREMSRPPSKQARVE